MITKAEMNRFVQENYPDITDRILDKEHVAGFCPKCSRDMGFQIIEIETARQRTEYNRYREDFSWPYMNILRCPKCGLFSLWILQKIDRIEEAAAAPATKGAAALIAPPITPPPKSVQRIYRITAIPPEGKYEIPELPQEPASLRKAYREAIQCLHNNCPMAAAAMFRRALQIITRDVLGAPPSVLSRELASLVGKPNKLGVILSQTFETNGYILREVGNQGAHPDHDPDLLTFTSEDAGALYEIFLEVVSELFVVPAAAQAAKQKLMERRKI